MNRLTKKVIVIILVSPLILLWIIAMFLANVVSELEDWSGDILDKAGKGLSKKLNILE